MLKVTLRSLLFFIIDLRHLFLIFIIILLFIYLLIVYYLYISKNESQVDEYDTRI
jgi:hypothetical protein